MKILQMIYTLSSGGAERFVVDLSNELNNFGHNVFLCTLRDDTKKNHGFYKSEISSNINYFNLKIKEGFRLMNFFTIFKLIKNIKPDIVHCHQNLIYYIFPLILLNKNNTKYFYTIHTSAEREILGKVDLFIRKYFFKNKLLIPITISPQTSKSFIEVYNTNSFEEIVNGRKLPSISKNFFKVKKIISDFKINNTCIFIHIGRCNEVKNQLMLINVFNRIFEDGKKFKLFIIGSGFDSKLGYEIKLKANENIIFVNETQNVADYLMNADAFCLSSTMEGMPISLIESLACGCIPICTPVGGIVDTIEDAITGFLSNTIKEDDYYKAVMNFYNKKSEISKLFLIEHYKSNFSIEECTLKHINLYCKSLAPIDFDIHLYKF
jgi:glycosyltransferase involved in cell wall biosynthesis